MRTDLSVTRIIRGLLWALAAIGIAVYLSTHWQEPALVSPSGEWLIAETALETWMLRCLFLSFIALAVYREVCRLNPNPRWSYNPLAMFLIFCLMLGGAYGILLLA